MTESPLPDTEPVAWTSQANLREVKDASSVYHAVIIGECTPDMNVPLYSQAALTAANTRADELRAERDAARAANEHDRTVIIDAHNAIHDAMARRSWLFEGRGSYEWDDDRYKDEFSAALNEIAAPLEILNKLGVDWAHCPAIDGEIQAARIDWKARAVAAQAEVERVTRERDEAREYGAQARIRENAAEDARITQHDRAELAETTLASVREALMDARLLIADLVRTASANGLRPDYAALEERCARYAELTAALSPQEPGGQK